MIHTEKFPISELLRKKQKWKFWDGLYGSLNHVPSNGGSNKVDNA